eukprot:TRINITY_DN4819_c0_g2_i4.p1 TRINITY_DN4819_c0_g2~~TRINITY_DN4819_c0_g2_i4.p1  ORF type:complete len:506 (+),score=149.93 TRINITY_DN4819_c0_g2_i4:1037-2554(+)
MMSTSPETTSIQLCKNQMVQYLYLVVNPMDITRICGHLTWKLLETKGDVPAGRYGHTIVINEENTKVYLFGGYDNAFGLSNDLYELDLDTLIWSPIKVTGEAIPEARYGHFSVLNKDKRANIQLLVFGGRGAKHVLDDIWVFDLKKSKWFELPVAGEKPQGRYGFGAFVSDKELFVFGGFDGKTVVFDDIWAINFMSSKRKWRHLGNGGFLERYYQTITPTPHGIVIFGGRRADHTLCLYVEEGINRGKHFQIHELRSHIQKLTLVEKVAEEKAIPLWINALLEVSYTKTNPVALSPFNKKYGEELCGAHTFQQNLVTFGVDGSFFSDMEVKLLDSIEPAHSFYLLLNIDLLPNITKKDIKQAHQNAKPLPLPFLKEEWTKLKQYFYTRKLPVTKEKCKDLLLIAAKHHMELLMDISCRYFFQLFDVYDIIDTGLQHKIEPVINYALWYFKCNYSVVKENPKFRALSKDIRDKVSADYWPGKAYETEMANWRAEHEKKNSNCLLQ